MFGLLKNNMLTDSDFNDFRQSYCGTCKTIGKLYGQKERFTLNTDVVFLSELLSEMNNCENDFDGIKINTCFKLPHTDKIPLFLKYTASINILLSYFKVLDNIQDSKYKLSAWKLLKIFERSKYKKAKSLLISIGLDAENIEKAINQQFLREKEGLDIGEFRDSFKYYAEITGEITGQVYKQGAQSISKTQFSNNLYEIGKNFGEIVYMIDAIEDYTKDVKDNRFNIFRFNSNGRINITAKQEVLNYINLNIEKIKEQINLLPISETKKQSFINRLCFSFSKCSNCDCHKSIVKSYFKNVTIKKRVNFAIIEARKISDKKENKIVKGMAFVYVAVILICVFLLLPDLVHASNFEPILKSDCCGNCGGCCDNCCCGKWCWGGDCNEKFGCCKGCGNMADESYTTTYGKDSSCCNCFCSCIPMAIGLACIGACLGLGGGGSSSSDFKIIFIEKDSGNCRGC